VDQSAVGSDLADGAQWDNTSRLPQGAGLAVGFFIRSDVEIVTSTFQ
jgi:hypothetical protein